jgi:SAM-dependent methyltransferase
MDFSIEAQKEFWDNRFKKEGEVWGDFASTTAVYALGLFLEQRTKKILVPGSGYGRNTKLFSEAGLDVSGVDISSISCEMAKRFDPLTVFQCGSVLDMSFLTDTYYDAIYCFNTLHLFYKKEREVFLVECSKKLKARGLLFFVVFSEEEPSYGQNRSMEKDTYESRPGRPTHYFTDDDLRWHFRNFEVLVTGKIDECEDHSQGPHIHRLRYIFSRKRN